MLKKIIERKLVVLIACIVIIGAGLFSSFTLPIRLLPDITEPVLRVQAWVDHDEEPDKLEKEVVIPIEEIVLNDPSVSKVEVSTNTRMVNLTITFKDTSTQEDQDEIKRDVEKKLDALSFDLDGSSVNQYSVEDMEIMMIAFSPGVKDDPKVRQELENVVIPQLKKIPDVKHVTDTLDLYDKHYVFELKPESLKGVAKTGSLVDEIRQLFSTNILGTLSYDGEQIPVRTEPNFVSLEQLHQLKVSDGSKVLDHIDVQVKSEADSIFQYVNGKAFYMVTIKIAKGTSEVKVAEKIKAKLQELYSDKSTNWEYGYVWDSSLFIGQAVKELVINIAIGGLLAIVILLIVYRSFRTMLVIGLSIPISIMMTMATMDYFGFSINLISLIGLGLGTGMIVDACIVVLDNIFHRIQLGEERKQAVIEGTKEVFSPVLSSVLTTVSVFVPVAILDGQIGNFMNQMAFTVTIALLSSLLVAFIVIPLLSLKFVRIKEQTPHFSNHLINKFTLLVTYCMDRKWRTVSLFITLLVIAIGLLITVIPKGFMGEVSERAIFINYEIEEKTPFKTSQEVLTSASKKIQEVEGVKDVYYWLNESNSHVGQMYIHYVDEDEMTRTEAEVKEEINQLFKESVPAVSYRVADGQGATGDQTIIKVSAKSIETLMAALPSIKEELSLYPGITGIESNINSTSKGWVIRFSEEQLQKNGLTRSSVEQYTGLVLNGVKDIDINVNGVQSKINIMSPEYFRHSSEALYQIPLDEKKLITLKEVATIETRETEGTRMRTDGQYETVLLLNLDKEKKDQVIPMLETYMKGYSVDEIQLSFGGAQMEQTEAFTELLKALAISVISVMIILIIQFNSMRQPFIIFISLLFTVIGVTVGFLVTGRLFDAMAMIGLVMLAGIVVNNAIVLIDFINQNRKKYETLREAIIEAVQLRIRPIFTTTMTTITGLIPMFIGGTPSSSFQTPIATSVIFGLMFSTFITLILVPILYEIFEGRRERKLQKALLKEQEEVIESM